MVNNNLHDLSTGVPIFTGMHIYSRDVTPSSGAWGNSPIRITAPFNSNNNARAGLSFENQGSNAGYLYLDLDNKLKLIDNSGVTHVITMT